MIGRMPFRRTLMLACALVALPVLGEGWRDRFTDSKDGEFDASEYLLDYRGVLPLPIIITEPAIGYGGGISALWFSESIRDAASTAQQGGRLTPPNILALAAFGTENGTRGVAAGGRFSFDQDRWRYRGGVGVPKINLDFFGIGGGGHAIAYTLKGFATQNDLTRRLGDSDHFLGMRFLYLDLKSTLQADVSGTGLAPRDFARRSSELGVLWQYDSRDNIFTTSRGIDGALEAMFASPSLGSDTSFRTYRARVFTYVPVTETFVGAFRIDGRTARGDVPFYQLPFIEMRGVPAARYQDENAGVLEAEGRYYVTPRWIAVAFAGVGRAWGRNSGFNDVDNVTSKGLGFRYLLARRLGLSGGLDVAWGPEKTAYYLSLGNAWK
jgi:hypothetical protein